MRYKNNVISFMIWYNKGTKWGERMRNDKGFTLIELLAVIFMVSLVLTPLLYSLSSNVSVNARMIRRNSADIMRISAIRAFEEVRFMDIYEQPDLESNDYIVFDRNNCTLLPNPDFGDIANSREICELTFNIKLQNTVIENSEHYRIYIYPYYMNEADRNNLISNEAIPEHIREAMESRIRLTDAVRDFYILNITVDILYDTEVNARIIGNGELSREWLGN